eukprot:6081957-Heterocapsa_arctica.AAC.1
MVSDTRQLTPGAIVRMTKLFELLLAGGCSNGIVLGSALQQALKCHIADDSGATDAKIGLDMHFHLLSNHIKTGMYMLRLLRMEEQ